MPAGWTKVSDTEYTKVVTENVDETEIPLVDKAGNSGTSSFVVKNIDKVAPTGTISYSTVDPTNGEVTVKLETSEPVAVPDGWTKVDDTHFTKVVSDNTQGNENVALVDKA